MRDGVMDVQQVEVVGLGHLRHARRQRQAIGRILKQRIVGDFDFVIMNARRTGVEPDGIGVGDEVDFVPARGQFHAQFGGDDAAAAVGGITGDSDVHGDKRSTREGIVESAWGNFRVTRDSARGARAVQIDEIATIRQSGLRMRAGLSCPLPCFRMIFSEFAYLSERLSVISYTTS